MGGRAWKDHRSVDLNSAAAPELWTAVKKCVEYEGTDEYSGQVAATMNLLKVE